ncbi:MAG: hypothetical protein A2V66_18410 [Ignavibacteria bacterium RBG_13_36_8]|nr:MAG: hypothetical protein A2V66_18410 [Ignavibacteria bacterium RBG_13_36_8]
MFRKEIKFIYDFTLNKVRKIGTYLTYDQIAKAEIHPSILHYISAEIDFLIFEDRQKILKDSVFDYSGEKVSDLFAQIADEVKKNKRFSLEYIAKLILHSASFNINYLARPRWSLMKLIFEDEEHKNTTEIKQILNYVYYYEYLKKIIVSYINRKKILSINYTEFEDLLNKIDKLGVQSNAHILVESALASMVNFFNLGEQNKHLIPLQAIELFLREKNLLSYVEKLKVEFPQDDKLVYDLKDYKKVFDGVKKERTETAEKFEHELIGDEKPVLEYEEEQIEPEDKRIEEDYKSDENIKIYLDEKTEDAEKTGLQEDTDLEPLASSNDVREKDLVEEKTGEDFEEQEQESEIIPESELDEGELLEETETDEMVELVDEERESDEFIDDTEIIDKDGSEETKEELIDEVENNITSEEETKQTSPGIEKIIVKTRGKSKELSDEEPTLFEVLEEMKEGTDNTALQSEEDMQKSEPEILEEKPCYLAKNGTKLEVSELIERKNITKVIEIVFDYDIEEFANTIDNACSCSTKNKAMSLLNDLFERNKIDTSSKEAETLKSVISEFFDRKSK